MPFSLTQQARVAHLNLTVKEFSHPSGLRHIHLDRADPELGFVVGFRTIPASSNGVAHVLEHLVLSGSKNYPVKDPFFSMQPRSVASFMNAMTYPDKTIYPFTTPSHQDYQNLLGVYLDAVFFPNLHELDFAREGWHYEATPPSPSDEQPGLASQPRLTISGVVFNEMKGVYDNPFATQFDTTQQAVFPQTTYAEISGGDPQHIPELTHDDLLKFHHDYYHPSRAVVVTYGSLNPEQVQTILEDKLFKHYNFGSTPAPLALPEFPSPVLKSATASFQSESPTDYAFYQAWPRFTAREIEDQLVDSFMTKLLLVAPTSPLQLKLSETGLFAGELSGINAESFRATLSLGVGKLTEAEIPRAQLAFQRILHEIVADGVSPDLLASSIRDFQLMVRNTESSEPYGFGLMESALNQALFGGSVANVLNKEQLLATIMPRLTVAGAKLWLSQLLSAPSSTLTFTPDPQWLAKRNQAELDSLEAKASRLSVPDWQAIMDQQTKITTRQDFTGNLNSLPKLLPADLPAQLPLLPPVQTTPAAPQLGHLTHHHVEAPTNQVGQLVLMIDTSSLPPEDWSWVALWNNLFLQMGTTDATWQQRGQQLSQAATKIRSNYASYEDINTPQLLKTSLAVYATTLEEQTSPLPQVLSESLGDVNWHDPSRLRYLFERLSLDIHSDPSPFIKGGVGHGLSIFSDFNSHLMGPVAARFLVDVAKQFQSSPASVIDKLDEITHKINALPRSLLTVGGAKIAQVGQDFVFPSHGSSPGSLPAPQGATYQPLITNEAWTVPHEVGAMYQIFQAPPRTHPDYPKLMVLLNVLNDGYLHTAIREKGGAYGSRANLGKLLTFSSYRDPRVAGTFTDFTKAIDWACAVKFTPAQVSEGIIATATDFLHPRTPRANALTAWSFFQSNFTQELRQQLYQGVLSATPQELVDVAQRYLRAPSSRFASLPSSKLPDALDLEMTIHDILPKIKAPVLHP